MGCGYAKMTGRMQWGQVFAVIAGLGLIFGAAEIVSWMGS